MPDVERQRERQRRWSAQNPDKVRAKQQRWEERHPGATAEKTRRYRLAHPDRLQKATNDTRKRYPGRRQAYRMVAKALRDGILVKPDRCDGCGAERSVQAHHADYGRPLDVRWLCVSCHKQHHLESPAPSEAGTVAVNRQVRGETHPNAKLTTAQVQEIREQFATGTVSKAGMARRYGVTDVLIGMIVRGKAWRND